MILWFVLIFAALTIGFYIGVKDLLPEHWYQRTGHLTTGGLLLLLWAMGAQIGSDQALLNQLASLGLKAAFLALGSVTASIVMLHLGVKFLIPGCQKNSSKETNNI